MTLTQPHRYGNWPFVLIEDGVIHTRPGTGRYDLETGTANIGMGIRFQAYDNRMYNFAGDVARFNEAVGYGNGVDFLVVKELDLDNPLFETHIESNHVVDRRTAFDGTVVVSFEVNVPLPVGESVRLVVFTDGQGQDGRFDSTAFQGSLEAYHRGDADLDRDVDVTDFGILVGNFGSVGADWVDGNFDFDGDIDNTDFNFLASNFVPDGYGASNAVAEPSIGIMLLLGIIGAAGSLRVRA